MQSLAHKAQVKQSEWEPQQFPSYNRKSKIDCQLTDFSYRDTVVIPNSTL